ncbi:hypothetical protein [Solidesulfovibrio fructosivorans]|nr:hypothetical protein [Solidesulfovibrio fructosivorans]
MERRAEKRVHPPVDVVLDFALWPADTVVPSKLPLAALRPPTACRGRGQALILADVASIGLGIRIEGPAGLLSRLHRLDALYIYLKLREYRPMTANAALSLFFHVKIAWADLEPGSLTLGLRVLHLGRGAASEKSLEFLDVRGFGVKELAGWIDALCRDNLGPEAVTQASGVHLDTLLAEPELTLPDR